MNGAVPIKRYGIIFDAMLPDDSLEQAGDAVMAALLETGVEDPYISTGANGRSFKVELTVEADTLTGALVKAVAALDEALVAADAARSVRGASLVLCAPVGQKPSEGS